MNKNNNYRIPFSYIPYDHGNNLDEANYWGMYWTAYNKKNYKYKTVSIHSIFYHLLLGIYNRFPFCCIKYFIGLHIANIPAAAFSAANLQNEEEFREFKKYQYVKCPNCLDKKVT